MEQGILTIAMDDVEANKAVEYLTEECGFWYDEDVTCIYGPGWKISGLRFLTASALLAYVGHVIAQQQAKRVRT